PRDTSTGDGVDFVSTATALQAPQNVVVASFDMVDQYIQLPALGPIPRERPMSYEAHNGALSAYFEVPAERAPSPFDTVLTGKGQLDAESIRASVKRRASLVR